MKFLALVNLLRRVEPGLSCLNAADVEITEITPDSRNVTPGALFAALPGVHGDGAAYVPNAITAGAVALLVARRVESSLPQIISANPRRTLGQLAAIFHGEPSRQLALVGITGTNGKTTISYAVRHILEHAERKCGLIGTVECHTGTRSFEARMTTPEATQLQAWLAEMRSAGLAAAAMEVSSHALSQYRVHGARFAAAVFTNLTQDHLDYHVSMEEYFQAKSMLFRMLTSDATAVVNLDDAWALRVLAANQGNSLTYGFAENAQLRARELKLRVNRMTFELDTPKHGTLRVTSPLTGRYNASNLLAAIGACMACGVDPRCAVEAVATFTGAPGRLERVFVPGERETPTVFVDYAHTPDALENVCQTLRQVCEGRKLVTVFGCGGDRDRTKRPLMGAIAERLSDAVVVTSDNPRSEDPDAIIREIRAGMRAGGLSTDQSAPLTPVRTVADRESAIAHALSLAGKDGVVLVAGKGHENYQIIGSERKHFDDREVARRLLSQWEANSHAPSRA